MVLQYLRHELHTALDVRVHVARLLNEDGFADVEEIAVRIAVVVPNGEQRNKRRAGVTGQPCRATRQRRLFAKEGHWNTTATLGEIAV